VVVVGEYPLPGYQDHVIAAADGCHAACKLKRIKLHTVQTAVCTILLLLAAGKCCCNGQNSQQVTEGTEEQLSITYTSW